MWSKLLSVCADAPLTEFCSALSAGVFCLHLAQQRNPGKAETTAKRHRRGFVCFGERQFGDGHSTG